MKRFITTVRFLHRYRLSIALTALLASAASRAPAQSSQVLPPVAVMKSGTVGFDTSKTDLRDARFADLGALMKQLDAGQKGEFETSAEYAARGRSRVPDEFFAVRMVGGATRCNPYFEYSADNALMTLVVYANSVTGHILDATGSISIVCPNHQVGTFEGVNAFGAKVSVKQFVDTTTEINDLRGDVGIISRVTIPMAREVAQIVKPDLGVVLSFRPAVDGMGRAFLHLHEYSAATRDAPIELTTERFITNARDVVLWLYNTRTGEVYKKIAVASLGRR